jgi:hypothetical protein
MSNMEWEELRNKVETTLIELGIIRNVPAACGVGFDWVGKPSRWSQAKVK